MSFLRLIFVCLLALAPLLASAATSTLAPLPTPTPTATPNREAPLDRYFGLLKMSPMGIRNGIAFLGKSYTWRTMTDDQIVHDAEWIEQAMYDWQRQFPDDPWLPPTAFHLMELYGEVQTADARAHATDMLHYVISNWPNTKYAHLARVRLAQGFPPFHEEPPMRPTFTPTPSPTPFGMTPTPSPTPEPTETPTPSPTPTPAPKRHHGLFR